MTNIGGQVTGDKKAKAIQDFLTAHSTEEHGITADNSSDSEGIKIAIDAWNSQYQFKDKNGNSIDDVVGNFDYKQYDYTDEDGKTTHKFLDALWKLSVTANGTSYGGPNGTDKTGETNSIHDIFYTFISNAEQLNGIQHYAEKSPYGPSDTNEFDILHANFLLKNDIDASGLSHYETIARGKNKDGTDKSYTGTFDGLGNRIIGLTAEKGLIANNGGIVRNMEIYSSVFTGENAGAVASNNSGWISNVTGLGNSITGTGSIGGMVGINQGLMENLFDQSTVIAGENTIAGGLAGTNHGSVSNAQTNSAVTTNIDSTDGKASQMGGIVGVNYDGNGEAVGISNVSAHGVTGKESHTETAGGIVGANYGTISEAYNESVLNGSSGIGGIAGINQNEESSSEGKKIASISNVANAMEIIGDAGSQNVGGLVGNQQSGSISDGRNTGTISGGENVGGMVGTNGNGSTLHNLENGSVAKITGVRNVGGIAGVNEGTISAENQSTLLNKGEIYGWENVGGIAGKNSGIIENVNSDIYLHIIGQDEKEKLQGSLTDISTNAQFFGGVTGENVGTITNATNSATVDATEATYVGGIVGRNATGGKLLGMGNSNQGKVIGKNYVGGVIGKNEVEITGKETDGVGVTNSGMVIATAGGAGGIIGENDADISYAVMKNEGEVHGNASEEGATQENGTGGIIGVNGENVSITNSSMLNTLKGKVTGISNVGGIIGINHGTVTGGRDKNDGFYEHQIYNNGTIQAGSYDEKTGKLNVEDSGSENIGGLIGSNTGHLTAGYNTGVISAKNSTNVGGIAGTNSGTIDQVFTNVMTKDGQNQTITGASNVGGIVGNNANSAIISNAYTDKNTTVTGTTISGLIAGANDGTISNVYGKDKLVGSGNAVTNGYGFSNKASNYDGFNFTGSDGKSAVWKIYEDHTNPLLKVFLTKANVKEDALNNLTYNGQNQLDINKLISDKTLINQKDADFADFTNSSSLLQSNASKNARIYTNWLWSAQIGSNNGGTDFDPNNLGYDFTVGNVEIAKKALIAKDFAASIVYGKQDGKDWQVDKSGILEGVISGDDVGLNWNGQWSKGEEYVKNQNKRDTADAGIYKENMNVTGIGLTGTEAGNYTISSEAKGDLTVKQANLEVSLKDISRVYGDLINKNYSGELEYKNGTKLVNGDSGLTVTVTKDGAIKEGSLTDVKKTQNVGDYTWTGTLGGVDNLNTNYKVTFTDSATSKVTPANLEVSLKDISRVYGNLENKDYSKAWEYKNGTKLVNGDSGLTVTATKDGSIKDGTLTEVKKTQNVGDYTWTGTLSGVDNLNTNYKVTFTGSAASKVTPANLEVSLKDISRVYGNLENKDYSKAWEYKNGTKLVNGDDGLTVTVTKDGAIKEGSLTDVKKTQNVGDYTWKGTLSGVDNLNTNYNVTFTGSAASKVTKAKLNLNLNDVKRTYGDTNITEGSYSLKDYKLVNGDSGTIDFDKAKVKDGGLIANGTKTNDVKEGDYTWSIDKADLTGDGLKLNNYDITVGTGKSYITPREVSLKDLTASIVYGSTDGIHAGDLSFKDGDIVYGDDVTVSGNIAIRENSKYANNKDNRDTADVGNYDSSLKVDNAKLNGEKAGNYNLVGDANGTITVTPAQLHVHTDDQTITIGQKPNYTGNLSGLVNGDSEKALGKLIYGIDDARYEQTAGTYIGVIRTVNGKYGELPSSYHKNYEITYDWGNLIVKPVDAPQFDYLFYDTPWDKQRNFCERRAELHFVDGGVHMG